MGEPVRGAGTSATQAVEVAVSLYTTNLYTPARRAESRRRRTSPSPRRGAGDPRGLGRHRSTWHRCRRTCRPRPSSCSRGRGRACCIRRACPCAGVRSEMQSDCCTTCAQ
eukprot:scaffold19400_cov63-Phaeocystis_antarctica.AAC.4